ncbi:T9SS type A sorting domain-containing protein [Bacteroidota bacterium]
MGDIQNDFLFNIQLIEAPATNSDAELSYLNKIKSQIPPKTKGTVSSFPYRATIEKPLFIQGFEGNFFNGHVPNDNDLAISNDGIIVSVTNSVIYFFKGDSQIHAPISLDTFAASFNLPHGKFDPKILYDPNEDKFVMAFLNGFDINTSKLFLAFSETNDPTGNWNIYTLPGNPLMDSSWSDFPMIAFSKDELFFTINLLRIRVGSETWKNTFKQTLIWQIDKNTGYSGDSLKTKLYHDIEFEGTRLRNLCPVHAGRQPTNDNMYFLSDRNFSLSTDSFYLVEISGKMDNPGTKISVKYIKSDVPYGVPPNADQPVNRLLETNDARVLDAYIMNDVIHYCGNTVNFNNNHATVFHGQITNPATAKNSKLHMIDYAGLEFGYPSLEYTGDGTTDEAILLANHTSDTTFPGVSAFFYQNQEWSDRVHLKSGETTVTVQMGKEQRWGDYTGMQIKYNENGVVWGSAYFGWLKSVTQRVNGTFISEIKSPTFASIEPKTSFYNSLKVYPNPVVEFVQIEFNSSKTQICEFKLFNANGQEIKLLQQTKVNAGKNRINLSLSPLQSGVYFLQILEENGEKHPHKLVVR